MLLPLKECCILKGSKGHISFQSYLKDYLILSCVYLLLICQSGLLLGECSIHTAIKAHSLKLITFDFQISHFYQVNTEKL